jgi:hypothetical protein
MAGTPSVESLAMGENMKKNTNVLKRGCNKNTRVLEWFAYTAL